MAMRGLLLNSISKVHLLSAHCAAMGFLHFGGAGLTRLRSDAWPSDCKKAKSDKPSQKAGTSAASSSSPRASACTLNTSPTCCQAGNATFFPCAPGETEATEPTEISTGCSHCCAPTLLTGASFRSTSWVIRNWPSTRQWRKAGRSWNARTARWRQWSSTRATQPATDCRVCPLGLRGLG